MLELYADISSIPSRPIIFFIEDFGLPVEVKAVRFASQEPLDVDFCRVSPNLIVPILRQGDFVLSESSAILKFLAEFFLSPVYPADYRKRARVNQWLDWFNRVFLFDYVYGLVYCRLLPGYALSPDAQRERLAWHEKRAEKLLHVLDAALAQGPFLLGEKITLADYLGSCFTVMGELTDVPLEKYPNIQQWLARMKARPGWQKAHSGFDAWRTAFDRQAICAA